MAKSGLDLCNGCLIGDDMKYISQNKLPDYRKKYLPNKCSILDLKEYNPVVDHDHNTGRIRGIISSEGNVLIGKIENFFKSRCTGCKIELPQVLRNIADYLEKEQGPLHPVGVRQLVKRFKRMGKDKQLDILSEHYDLSVINECKNSEQRSKLYRAALVKD